MVAVRGNTVRGLRMHRGFAERRLARELGRDGNDAARMYIRRLEQREETEMTREEAERIADALGVTVDELSKELLFVLTTARGGVLDLGGAVPAWTDAKDAQDRRKALGLHGFPVGTVSVAAFGRDELEAVAADNLGGQEVIGHPIMDDLLAVDLEGDAFDARVLLEAVLRGYMTPEHPDFDRSCAAISQRINLATAIGALSVRIERARSLGDHERASRLVPRRNLLLTVWQRAIVVMTGGVELKP